METPPVQPEDKPLSSPVRDFSAALDDVFKLESSLDELSTNVEQKKEAVTAQSKELEELEERLRATEQRLKQAKRASQVLDMSRGSSPRPLPFRGSGAFHEESQQVNASTTSSSSPSSSSSFPDGAGPNGQMPDHFATNSVRSNQFSNLGPARAGVKGDHLRVERPGSQGSARSQGVAT
ncbi:hypothetical protein K402DRAFT_125713 [Aulographum hederae CBS 113979]|uniref:Uncharacterized protein n=1 Tax=Aulographum hederae CBS 113979 TaxID=1176131 RepID=A0A6G1HEF4_9PEZI|nr:hypothetical protein K402DRAFT_125713 [Aulographum hederae CBS 113979]